MDTQGLYESILENLEDGIYFVDTARRFTQWNPAAEKITGYAAGEMLGRNCQSNILDHIDTEGRPLCRTGCPLFATLGDGEPRTHDMLLRHKDGHRMAVQVKTLPMYGREGIVGAVEIFTPRVAPVTVDKMVESLTEQAMTDALTGLPNRMYLESFLQHKQEEYRRFGNPYAVLFMDIDDFRSFNNQYGHHVGDRVLATIAGSLRGILRGTDAVGRWGGEEFLGIFALRSSEEAAIVAEKVRVLVENSEILHEGERISVTVSVGVTVGVPEDDGESVVVRADALMYESKSHGKNCVSTDVGRQAAKPAHTVGAEAAH